MQDFLNNVSRYPRYLISFSLGVLLTMFSPLVPLFKRPVTAVATVIFLLAAAMFLGLTLRAMLGLNPA